MCASAAQMGIGGIRTRCIRKVHGMPITEGCKANQNMMVPMRRRRDHHSVSQCCATERTIWNIGGIRTRCIRPLLTITTRDQVQGILITGRYKANHNIFVHIPHCQRLQHVANYLVPIQNGCHPALRIFFSNCHRRSPDDLLASEMLEVPPADNPAALRDYYHCRLLDKLLFLSLNANTIALRDDSLLCWFTQS